MGTREAQLEASALTRAGSAPLRGPTPLLRLASDERLVVLTRRGNQAAYEALVGRYQSRLLAFCRHMVGSREDAEDVLQEVFAAAFSAMVADERPINVRPWLYRIARNRSLNHLRRQQPIGVDSMDVHIAEQGTTTADKVHKREEFRLLMEDVQTLAETQRTALVLREIDALRYDQIAEAMDTTIPAVKSLLVRARVSLAEAAEARTLSCDDVRLELGEVAEGLHPRLSAPARRHVRECERCAGFRKQLRSTNKALAAAFPVGPLLFLKKGLLAHLGTTASAGSAATATTAAVAAGSSAGSASLLSAGIGAVASKTAAGLAAAALVTAGAVEVNHAQTTRVPATAATPSAPYQGPVVATSTPLVVGVSAQPAAPPSTGGAEVPDDVAAALAAQQREATAVIDASRPGGPQQGYDTTTLPTAGPVAGGASAPSLGSYGGARPPAAGTPTAPATDTATSGGAAADPPQQPVAPDPTASTPAPAGPAPAVPVTPPAQPADPAPGRPGDAAGAARRPGAGRPGDAAGAARRPGPG